MRESGVDHDAAVDREPGLCGEFCVGRKANADQHEIGGDLAPAVANSAFTFTAPTAAPLESAVNPVTVTPVSISTPAARWKRS